MPPKKDDKKKPGSAVAEGATQLITADQLESAKELPEIDSFVFTNLFAFKLVRNQKRLLKTIFKQYNFGFLCFNNSQNIIKKGPASFTDSQLIS